jgi:WS/DGAT/MGAT family acyltransferase
MFFLTESPQSPKHVGAVQVFELPKSAPDTYLRDLVEAFRNAPVEPPFNKHPHFAMVGMPEWREDDEMEMTYHVRHSALPSPGTNAQLMEVVQRLHAPLLDRRRPGWICQIIEGLENNRFAIYTKIHHAYIDGMSGVKRMYGSLSTSPKERQIVPTWSYRDDNSQSTKTRRRESGREQITRQVRGLTQMAGFFTDISMQWFKLRQGKAQIPYSAAYTRMNRPLEWDTRSTAVCTVPLDQVKAIGKHQGCTVNEVVLAIIGAALDDYLERHGEQTRSPLVALCPMSLRQAGDDTASTQVSAVHVRLGEPGARIKDRLAQVVESSHEAKDMVSGLSTEAMMDYGVFFFALMELLNRSRLDRYIAPSYNVLISNVPGPGNEAMYLCGSRMVASYPISTLLPGVNLNATVLSHGNSLDFGLMGDMHSLPDLEIVAERMEARFEELRRSVLGAAKAARPKAKTKSKSGTRAKTESNAKAGTATKAKTKARTGTKAKDRTKTTARRKASAKADSTARAPRQSAARPKSAAQRANR